MFTFAVGPRRTRPSRQHALRGRAAFSLIAAFSGWLPASMRAADAGYIVTTLAGRPTLEHVDGVGNDAAFAQPGGVAADPAGNLFVADTFNHVIRKITPAHVVTTVAGRPGEPGSTDGSGRDAQFRFPAALACDPVGNIYVADTQNNTIRKITAEGIVSTFAGQPGQRGAADGAAADARFSSPSGIAIDLDGNLFVADAQNATIRRITPARVVSTFAGHAGSAGAVDGPAADARFAIPFGIAVDQQRNLYVSDTGAATIRVITPDRIVSTLAGAANLRGSADGTGADARFTLPSGLALDRSGNLYVGDLAAIRKIAASGAVTTFAGQAGTSGEVDGPGPLARFESPSGVALDPEGTVFIADAGNSAIRAITPSGNVSTIAGLPAGDGSVNGRDRAARFRSPNGIAADAAGNLYVAEGSMRTIRRIAPDGTVANFAGAPGQFGSADGVGTNARFGYPDSVAADASGNLYVSDGDNFNIRKITRDGIVSTLAGATGFPGWADGTGSAAQFSNPGGLAVDAGGNLYVADRDGPTIRRISPAGVVTTFAGQTGKGGSIDGPRELARLVRPESIVIDAAGNLLVVDGATTVRKIMPDGAISTVAGRWRSPGTVDGPGPDARFTAAVGLAGDSRGNLFVVEVNGVIRRIDPAFTVSTIAGKPLAPGGADGRGDAARFNFPTSIATDRTGNFYVADTDNNTIRKGASTSQLVNLSVRARAGSGGQTLVVGFVVAGGTAPKPVLVRAVGPTLVELGVQNSLADPQLVLVNAAGVPLRQNDNWGGAPEIGALFTRLGAYPLEGGSKDAAISTTLAPGLYSAHVTSADASSGIALLEAYDADQTSSARFVNASVRAVSGGGENVVIAGFVLVGSAPKTVLVRAVGPSLASHGLDAASLLQDPKLTLYHHSTPVGANDDWGGTAELKGAFSRVGAFAPDADSSKDAALLAMIEPGLYTVVISGDGLRPGVVLVEVYEMP